MQRKRAIFSDKQPEYRYMPLGNGFADVFIYKFIEEITDKEGNVSNLYEFNEFRVNTQEITEEMISGNPLDYLDYSAEEEAIALEDRVSAIEEAIVELAEVISGD
ncbi:MAG: hypothetical protein IJ068_06880 [Bacilli bacterium]|nr:hypothetical protein [Bacilli bacterium]